MALDGIGDIDILLIVTESFQQPEELAKLQEPE
jgi:hypothetical protein